MVGHLRAKLIGGFPRIPAELRDFLRRESFTLLIKGSTGTGKTTLALTILGELRRDGRVLYMSTRTSPAQMMRDHSRLWRSLGFGETHTDVEVPPKVDGFSEFVDARLDEPGPLFERITSELMDTRSPTIALDSWNSLESVQGEELRTNMRVLQAWRERVAAKLILIGEDPEDTRLDSLVDGIVVLSQGELDKRRFREILISKLRGTNVLHPRYFFTLSNGLFASFEHFTSKDLELGENPMPRLYERRRSIGRKRGTKAEHPQFASARRKGLPVGTVISFELDQGVDPRMALVLLRPLVTEFAFGGNTVILLLPQGISRDFASKFSKATVPESLRNLVRLHWSDVEGENFRSSGPKLSQQNLQALLNRPRSSRIARPSDWILSMLGVDEHSQDKPQWGEPRPREASGGIKSDPGLVLLIRSMNGQGQPSRIDGVIDARLKILYVDGTLFLESKTPFSQLYAITRRTTDLGARMTIEPMV